MTCKDSHFLIGLGIGSIFGALAYGFARSARAKKMKAEVFDALHRIEGHTECLIESAKETFRKQLIIRYIIMMLS